MKYSSLAIKAAALAGLGLLAAAPAQAFLLGSVPLAPGGKVVPGDATGQAPGTLLANLSAPFTFTCGNEKWHRDIRGLSRGRGALDFYYQLQNDPNSATALARETDVSFGNFLTMAAFRRDGGTLGGGIRSRTGMSLP